MILTIEHVTISTIAHLTLEVKYNIQLRIKVSTTKQIGIISLVYVNIELLKLPHNVQGTNEIAKKQQIDQFLTSSDIDMAILTETKLNTCDVWRSKSYHFFSHLVQIIPNEKHTLIKRKIKRQQGRERTYVTATTKYMNTQALRLRLRITGYLLLLT